VCILPGIRATTRLGTSSLVLSCGCESGGECLSRLGDWAIG
ncbi:hypothetical protein CTA1_6398, partial [Colletotrichum tanaceti]